MKYLIWVWPYLKKQKILLMFLVLLSCIQIATQFGGTFFQKQLIDNVIVNGETELLSKVIMMMFLSYLITATMTFFSPFVSLHNYVRLRFELSRWLLKYINHVPISRIQRERINDMVGLFMWQLHLVPYAFSDRLWNFIKQLTMCLLLIGFLFWVSPLMLAVCIIVSVIYVYMGRYLGRKIKHVTKEKWDARYQLGVCLEEGLSATRETVSYHLEAWDRARYDKLFHIYYAKILEETKANNSRFLYGNSLEWATLLFIFFFGAYLVYTDQMSIGTFVVSYIFGAQFLNTMKALFEFGTDIVGHMSHVERLQSFSEAETMKPGEYKLESQIKSIVFDHVSFHYPENDQQILKDINYEMPIGKTVAIVGSSGSGKSTMAGILFGLQVPTEGHVRINDVPLQQWDFDTWRQRTSIVMQEPYLFHNTIRENLAMGHELSEKEIYRICRVVQLEAFIESLPLGLDTLVGERGITLSGGQRQRLAIARAMLRPSEVLILDEATSALDLETERRFQKLLREERKGKTTVIIAHRLSTVRDANLIIVMDQGQLVEQGCHEELMLTGTYYRRLVESQEQLVSTAV
jgi:ABC-type multidrug transport system fused ATPase/permease subunit